MLLYMLCKIAEIPLRGARALRLGETNIALFRLSDGRVLAVDNVCPHKGGPLSEGIVTGSIVICPMHNWAVNLATGRVLPPHEGSVRTYEVKVQDRDVWICL